MQLNLVLIPHRVGHEIIEQRAKDGYINATAMCKAANKNWFDYRRQRTIDPFLGVLATETGIPASELIQSLRGGGNLSLQGTWVHPQMAIHLASWLSPEFAVQVTKWVFDWMSGRKPPAKAELPYHIRRYVINSANVPPGFLNFGRDYSYAYRSDGNVGLYPTRAYAARYRARKIILQMVA
jgi:KilA-N domain